MDFNDSDYYLFSAELTKIAPRIGDINHFGHLVFDYGHRVSRINIGQEIQLNTRHEFNVHIPRGIAEFTKSSRILSLFIFAIARLAQFSHRLSISIVRSILYVYVCY